MRQPEEEGGQDELSALCAEVLEDHATEPETPHGEGHRSLLGQVRRSWGNLRPVGRVMRIGGLVILCLAVAAGSRELVASIFAEPVPTVTPAVSIVPIPISISLLGGRVFPLRIFPLQDVWGLNSGSEPLPWQGLDGVECRVVSLPWTVQLEAMIRTLARNDEIRLSMSNYDSLLYKVQSIEQVPSSEIAKLANNNAPCLLVILSRNDTDTRLVLIAKP